VPRFSNNLVISDFGRHGSGKLPMAYSMKNSNTFRTLTAKFSKNFSRSLNVFLMITQVVVCHCQVEVVYSTPAIGIAFF
jgi:hypothetical protein